MLATNLAFVGGLVALGVAAFAAARRKPAESVGQPAALDARARARATRWRGDIDLPAHLDGLRRMYGVREGAPTASRTLPAPGAESSTELPLSLFAVVTWFSDGAGNDVVGLRSKDPARPESVVVSRERPVGRYVLESVDPGEQTVAIVVRRGKDRFRYTFDRRRRNEARVAMTVAQRDDGEGRPAPAPSTARFLPFYGPDGRPMGIRVIALQSGAPLARAGVLRGDVIVSADGATTLDAGNLQERLAAGWTPATVAVVPPDAPTAPPRLLEVSQ